MEKKGIATCPESLCLCFPIPHRAVGSQWDHEGSDSCVFPSENPVRKENHLF